MRSDIERVILHYYPGGALRSPLGVEGITWDFDTEHAQLRALVSALEGLSDQTRPGTRGQYDISEEILVGGRVRLQVSYLGPFATLNRGETQAPTDEDERALIEDTQQLCRKHGMELLTDAVVNEPVSWVRSAPGTPQATVWTCLFCIDET